MVAPRRSSKRYTRWCIFCERPAKMTNEHVWGKWLKPYAPPGVNKHELVYATLGKIGTQDKTYTQIKAGHPLNSQVRVVCAECNNGWLSGIQERAKSHMIPLIEGQQKLIGAEAQTAIATWATMATITGEHISRQNEVAPFARTVFPLR